MIVLSTIEGGQLVDDRGLDQPVPQVRYRIAWQSGGLGGGARVGDHLRLARLVADVAPLRLDARGGVHVAKAAGEKGDQLAVGLIDAGANLRHGGASSAGENGAVKGRHALLCRVEMTLSSVSQA